jgi:glycosyltransferase involved in cell wall biosynthesis
VGQGPLLEKTIADAAQMGLQDSVFFAGFRDDAREIIAAADLFVLSSEFEGMPVSVLEAMGTRTPVLSTNVGGLSEMIDNGKDGVLVEFGNPVKLAAEIVSTLQNEPLRQSIASLAYCKAKSQFDVRHMVRRTEELYVELLEGRSS